MCFPRGQTLSGTGSPLQLLTIAPDGRRFAYSTDEGLFLRTMGELDARLIPGTGPQSSPTVNPVFSPDIGIVSLEGGADSGVTPLLGTMFNERNAEVSPDGRWMAYESDESGQSEVYVRPFPDVDAGRWQVSTGGGMQPVWARNGGELFYRSGDAVMSVPVETSASFVSGNPVVLFTGQYAPSLGGRNYDVSPDGQRFLMLKVGTSGANRSQAPAATRGQRCPS